MKNSFTKQVEGILEIMRIESPELYIHTLEGMHIHIVGDIYYSCKSVYGNWGEWGREVIKNIEYYVLNEEIKTWMEWVVYNAYETLSESMIEDFMEGILEMTSQDAMEYLRDTLKLTNGKALDVLRIMNTCEDYFIEELKFKYDEHADEEKEEELMDSLNKSSTE